jgi:hypothetical protein
MKFKQKLFFLYSSRKVEPKVNQMQNSLKKFETNNSNESFISINFLSRSDVSQETGFEYGSYYVLLKSLSWVGLYFPRYPKPRFEPLTVTAITLIHLSLVYRIIILFISFGTNHFWSITIDLLRTLAALNVCDQFLYQQKVFHKCLYQSLPVFESRREQTQHKIVENVFNSLTVIAWVYMSFRIAFDIYVVSSDQKYFDGFVELNFQISRISKF